MKNLKEPAFPSTHTECNGFEKFEISNSGLTTQEHAAIILRVPRSGDPDIDAMIREGNRRDLAAQAMQGLLSIYDDSNGTVPNTTNVEYMVGLSIHAADTLIAELEKSVKP